MDRWTRWQGRDSGVAPCQRKRRGYVLERPGASWSVLEPHGDGGGDASNELDELLDAAGCRAQGRAGMAVAVRCAYGETWRLAAKAAAAAPHSPAGPPTPPGDGWLARAGRAAHGHIMRATWRKPTSRKCTWL